MLFSIFLSQSFMSLGKSIFATKPMDLNRMHYIGFGIDHTLITYLDNLDNLP